MKISKNNAFKIIYIIIVLLFYFLGCYLNAIYDILSSSQFMIITSIPMYLLGVIGYILFDL